MPMYVNFSQLPAVAPTVPFVEQIAAAAMPILQQRYDSTQIFACVIIFLAGSTVKAKVCHSTFLYEFCNYINEGKV